MGRNYYLTLGYLLKGLRLLFLVSVLCWFSPAAIAQEVPGEIIVRFKPGIIKIPKGISTASTKATTVTAASVKSLNEKYRTKQFKQLYRDALDLRPDWHHLEDTYVIDFPREQALDQVVKDFAKDPNVETVQKNVIVRAFEVTPNDPYYAQQWGLTSISASQGWGETTGSSESEIAVLDTGINYYHEDLVGRVDLVKAKDYVNNDNDPMDDFGHGTAVSGVIAASGNNAKGIAGLEWKAKILPIKVLNDKGEGVMSDINKALAYLTALKSTGTNIVAVNMSLGQTEQDLDTEQRCLEAYNIGLVLIAAAGNENLSTKTYPAAYPTVVAVAAVDQNDQRSVWSGTQASNYGSWIGISAPGTNILSTDKNLSYSYNNGTSLASPFVAGVAALLKATNPTITVSDIISRLKGTADNIDVKNPGYEGKLGTGRLNSYKALSGLTAEITYPTSSEAERYLRGTVAIRGSAKGWDFTNYRLEAISNSSFITIETKSTQITNDVLGSWNTTGLNGDYLLRLKSFSSTGASMETSVNVIVDNLSPEVAVTSPASNATIDGSVNILGKSKELYLNYYRLEYGKGAAPTSFEQIGTYWVPVNSGLLGTWETAGLSGTYTLRLTAYDKAGNSNQTSLPVKLAGVITPTKEAQTQTGLPVAFVLPNPFDRSVSAETTFVYYLKGNFNSSIYLFDLSGSLIWQKNFAAGDNGGKAGLNNTTWNGANFFGEYVPGGVYLFQVAADGKLIAKGKIIVIN